MNDTIFYSLCDVISELCDVILEEIETDNLERALYFHVKLIDVLKVFNLYQETLDQLHLLTDYQEFNKKMFEMIVAGKL